MIHIGITGPISLPSLREVMTEWDDKWPKGVGGIPVNHLIVALIKRGFKVSVFSNSPEIEEKSSFEYHQENLSIFLGPARKRVRYQIADFYKVERKYIVNAIKKVEPSIVHAHWQYQWAWAALDSGVTTLVTCHDSPLHVFRAQTDFFRFFRALVALIVLRKAEHLTTVSPYCAKGLRLFTRKKIDVIPNFEQDYIFSLFKENKEVNSSIKIAMINNGFHGLKNVKAGIRAFNKFKTLHPEAQLFLYGKGHESNGDAEAWCKANKISSSGIFFQGSYSFETLMHELSSKDVFLHTSLEESFGMVLIESMAMKIPVVAGKNSGGPAWILENGGGILVDINDENQVAEALNKLVEPAFYKEQSETAHQIALSRFSEQKVFAMYSNLYEALRSENPETIVNDSI